MEPTTTTTQTQPQSQSQTQPQSQTTSSVDRIFQERDDDYDDDYDLYDLIEFGIASNGGRLSITK